MGWFDNKINQYRSRIRSRQATLGAIGAVGGAVMTGRRDALNLLERMGLTEGNILKHAAIGAVGAGAQIPGLVKTAYQLKGDVKRGIRALPPFLNLTGMAQAEGTFEKGIFGASRYVSPYSRALGHSVKGTVPGFFARTAGEHLGMGVARMGQMFRPMNLGVALGVAGYFAFADTEDGDILKAHNGVARKFITNLAMEPGFLAGGAIGAAIGQAAIPIPVIGGAVGYLAGGMAGSIGTMQLADIPFKMADKGREMRLKRTLSGTFTDSEQAYTMRQRSMNMIRDSMLNARSSMGSEAISFHG